MLFRSTHTHTHTHTQTHACAFATHVNPPTVSGSSHSSARKARRHRLRLRIGSGGTRVCTRVAAELGGLAKGSGFNFSPQMPGFALVTQSTSKLNVAVCFCAHPQMHWSHDAPPVCLSYTIPPCGEQAQRGGCRSVRRHSTAPPHSLHTGAEWRKASMRLHSGVSIAQDRLQRRHGRLVDDHQPEHAQIRQTEWRSVSAQAPPSRSYALLPFSIVPVFILSSSVAALGSNSVWFSSPRVAPLRPRRASSA